MSCGFRNALLTVLIMPLASCVTFPWNDPCRQGLKGSIVVEVAIDGATELTLSKNTAQWFHAENVSEGPRLTSINGKSWTPQWPKGIRAIGESDVFNGVGPEIKGCNLDVDHFKQAGRNDMVVTSPRKGAIKAVFTDPQNGPDTYKVTLNWRTRK